MAKIPCTIRFCFGFDCKAIGVVTTGFKMLEKNGIVRIAAVENDPSLGKRGRYCHGAIVEVEALGKRFVYDLADGYQSMQKKELFDESLDNVDYYFKLSYRRDFQNGMRNADKVVPSGFSVLSTCPGNPIDKLFYNVNSPVDALRAIRSYPARLKFNAENRFEKFVSHNTFDSYKLLFWARLWDPTPVDPVKYNASYPYLSAEEAKAWADETTDMISTINRQRIEIIRNLHEHFGPDFVYGICDNAPARQLCPELIVPNPLVDSPRAFYNSLKQNYVCVNSYGMHWCTGAKMSEFMAAGRAMLNQPLKYEYTEPLTDGTNFVEYISPDELPGKAEKLLGNVEQIKAMENANYDYVTKYCTPDAMVRNTLRIVFPDENL